jgi:protein-L-isoaspartate(D-aspartate) O-methyltransferase
MPAAESEQRMEFMLTLRQRGISDKAVLRAMDAVPREHFVDTQFFDSAYADQAMPIACGQTISQPYVVAYMTEQLQVRPNHRVLEVGTGSGYQAAILSKLCRELVTIERFRTLVDLSRRRLDRLGCRNVTVLLGDAFSFPDIGEFDRIIVTAAMEEIPESLLKRLRPNGVLLAPEGPADTVQRLVRIVKTGTGYERRNLLEVRFVPALPGVARET